MIPKTWHEINVAQLMEISQAKNNMRDIQALLSLFIDTETLTIDEFMEAAAELYQLLTTKAEIVDCEEFVLNGETFKLRNIEDFDVLEYCDYTELSKDTIQNLPLLLGLIYEGSEDSSDDYKDKVKTRAQKLLEMPADTAQSALAFFLRRSMLFITNTLDSLESKTPALKPEIERLRETLLFMSRSSDSQDGTSQAETDSTSSTL